MKCPQCDGDLTEVPRESAWLNEYQYDSVKAGDWYCETCPDNHRGQSGLCYWLDREVCDYKRRQCESIMRL